MKISRNQIASKIAQMSLNDQFSKKNAKEFAAYLIEEKRVNELDSILRDVSKHWMNQGRIDVVAKSAYPLSSQALSEIKAKIKSKYPSVKRIIITQQIDQIMIGGVSLEFADQQLDLSIRTKLNKFKQLSMTGRA